ncbi:MAG: TrkH family potassium uptake protein [Tissierellaceae bacterium]|nr:TrkH family potassium uptake protein [Tissierellaceae bacterium]
MTFLEMITIDFLKRFDKSKLNPPRVLAIAFALIILFGANILNLPIASADGESIGFINALFTASSSVCVTGLVVVNTAEHWSLFGQVVIITLIQIGGLGFMTMATIVALLLGKKITLKDRLVMQEELNSSSLSGLVKLTKYVIATTFIIEGIGAIFLSTRFIPIYGLKKGIWFSVFHAISAFCNAGFDVIGNNMIPFVDDIVVNFAIGSLVILGGLGFTVYLDISKNKNIHRCSLHTKLVLLISAILLILGSVLIFIIEYNNPETLGNLSLKGKILASTFQSIIARTAGFNSVDMAPLYDTTIFVLIILMFIGGSPGSTAGGIKTTTFGVIFLTVRSVLKGNDDVEVLRRRIPNSIVLRAIAITAVSLLLVTLVTMILTVTEQGVKFIDLLFETVSAFATVGLSRNLSPELSDIGKFIIALTMYAGKVGPLTLVFALAKKQKTDNKKYRYPEGKIIIG